MEILIMHSFNCMETFLSKVHCMLLLFFSLYAVHVDRFCAWFSNWISCRQTEMSALPFYPFRFTTAVWKIVFEKGDQCYCLSQLICDCSTRYQQWEIIPCFNRAPNGKFNGAALHSAPMQHRVNRNLIGVAAMKDWNTKQNQNSDMW